MPIIQAFLPEFDHEMDGTRRALERAPGDRFSWAPHQKSMTLGGLTSHIAEVLGLCAVTFTSTEFDLMPEGKYDPADFGSVAGVLQVFDQNRAAVREQLLAASDETSREPWSLLAAGREIFRLPRVAVYRSLFNHVIHHRAQLTVYLRLLDVPVPSLYGPSADEGQMAS